MKHSSPDEVQCPLSEFAVSRKNSGFPPEQGIHGNYLLDTAQDLSHMKKGQASDLPEIEIEITPELLKEGVRVLDRWQEFDLSLDEETVARDVYIAMAELANSPRRRVANRTRD
jgi:hypothetical protein